MLFYCSFGTSAGHWAFCTTFDWLKVGNCRDGQEIKYISLSQRCMVKVAGFLRATVDVGERKAFHSGYIDITPFKCRLDRKARTEAYQCTVVLRFFSETHEERYVAHAGLLTAHCPLTFWMPFCTSSCALFKPCFASVASFSAPLSTAELSSFAFS